MIGLSKNVIDAHFGEPVEEIKSNKRWDSGYFYFVSIVQGVFGFMVFFKNGLSTYVEYPGNERIDDTLLFGLLETFGKEEKWRRDKAFDCWHCETLNLLAYRRQDEERDIISVCTPETFLSILASKTKGLWSEQLGCFETHLKRKHDYPEVFNLKTFEISADEIEEARLRDVSEYWKLQADVIEVIESITPNSTLSEIHEACSKIEEEFLPRCAEIGRTNSEVLNQLVQVRKKWRALLKKAIEYTPEEFARLTMAEALADYLIGTLSCEFAYQVKRKDSPIQENEIIPSLLCESPRNIQLFLEWDADKKEEIRSAAIELLKKVDSFPRKKECLEALDTEGGNTARVPPLIANQPPPLPTQPPPLPVFDGSFLEKAGYRENRLKLREKFPGLFGDKALITDEQIQKARELDKEEAIAFEEETTAFCSQFKGMGQIPMKQATDLARDCGKRITRATQLGDSVTESNKILHVIYDVLWKQIDENAPAELKESTQKYRDLEMFMLPVHACLRKDISIPEEESTALILVQYPEFLAEVGKADPEFMSSTREIALRLLQRALKSDPKNNSKYIGYLRALGISDYKLAQECFISAFRTGDIYGFFYIGCMILFRGSQSLQKLAKPQPIKCPRCGLLNPPKTSKCDCGVQLNS